MFGKKALWVGLEKNVFKVFWCLMILMIWSVSGGCLGRVLVTCRGLMLLVVERRV